MRMSKLVTKTRKDASQSDPSRNAQLLTRAGYVSRLMAGAYSFLPLGKRVLENIERIVREEMDAIGGQEILLPALQPKENWEQTGRWDTMDVLYKLKGAGDSDLALGPTHEEIVTPLITSYINSYRDLPTQVYQIQTKYRNEKRAKSGLLRGREFRMKDMYSFHDSEESLDDFYNLATDAYHRIYQRCGLGDITLLTYASGGSFSKYSHEFQAITPYGEDTIYRVPGTKIAINKEIIEDSEALAEIIPNYKPGAEKDLEELKAIEVGNIFKLGKRFTNAFGASFADGDGNKQEITNGCYGLGTTRLMGSIAECLGDDNGLVWPEEVAPYRIHLTSLARTEQDIATCEQLYGDLTAASIDVLYDDRHDLNAGNKLADADLIGIPHRILVSPKTLAQGSVEWKKRASGETQLVPIDTLQSLFA